jgi:hypothetical protein
MDFAMNACPIDALTPETPLWVWDGTWLPAHLIQAQLESSTATVLVPFNHGISAPVAASRIVLRDPALRESDRPSATVSALMYAESMLMAAPSLSNPSSSLIKSATKVRFDSSASRHFRRSRRARARSSL